MWPLVVTSPGGDDRTPAEPLDWGEKNDVEDGGEVSGVQGPFSAPKERKESRGVVGTDTDPRGTIPELI